MDILAIIVPLVFIGWIAFVFYASKYLPKIEVRRLVGTNGYNTPFKAIVDPTTRYPVAVLAQEVYEAKWKIHPTRMIFHKTKRQTIEREIRGHEIEVQAARYLNLYEGDDNEEQHRMREVRALKTHYNGFESMTEKDILAAMVKFKPTAIGWVRDNIDEILIQYEINNK